MHTISMQKLEGDKVLESQGLAAMTFTLNWSDGRATHEDELHVEKFSVWREADFLPADIGQKITGGCVNVGAADLAKILDLVQLGDLVEVVAKD